MNRNIEWIFCTLAGVLTVAQTNEVFQLVELILTTIATAVALAFTVWKWYHKASADGKITKDEVNELVEELDKEINKDKDHE